MVRNIEFYGMCSTADVSTPKIDEENFTCLGIGKLLCVVCSLQEDTVWLYRDWGRYAGPGNILFHKDSDTVWFSFSGL